MSLRPTIVPPPASSYPPETHTPDPHTPPSPPSLSFLSFVSQPPNRPMLLKPKTSIRIPWPRLSFKLSFRIFTAVRTWLSLYRSNPSLNCFLLLLSSSLPLGLTPLPSVTTSMTSALPPQIHGGGCAGLRVSAPAGPDTRKPQAVQHAGMLDVHTAHGELSPVGHELFEARRGGPIMDAYNHMLTSHMRTAPDAAWPLLIQSRQLARPPARPPARSPARSS